MYSLAQSSFKLLRIMFFRIIVFRCRPSPVDNLSILRLVCASQFEFQYVEAVQPGADASSSSKGSAAVLGAGELTDTLIETSQVGECSTCYVMLCKFIHISNVKFENRMWNHKLGDRGIAPPNVNSQPHTNPPNNDDAPDSPDGSADSGMHRLH
jgi:hypothetical protein